MRAICPAIEPVAPAAAVTTTASPATGRPIPITQQNLAVAGLPNGGLDQLEVLVPDLASGTFPQQQLPVLVVRHRVPVRRASRPRSARAVHARPHPIPGTGHANGSSTSFTCAP